MEQIPGGIQQELDDRTGQPREKKRKAGEAKGRKDAGQEQVPDKAELKKALPGLKKLSDALDVQRDALSKKVKAVAKSSGFNSAVVRAILRAYVGEKEDRELATRKVEQLTLGFEVLEEAE